MNSQYPTSYSTLIQYMDLTATVWLLETTSGLGDTGSDVIRRWLTSSTDAISCTITRKNGEKRRPVAKPEVEIWRKPEI